MGNNDKIGFTEAISLLLILPFTHLLITLPKIIFKDQGSSSILNTFYVSLIAIFIIWILNLLFKNFKGKDILDISDYLLGKTFKFIVGIIFIVYIIIISSLILRNISENLKSIYFQSTPMPYILFFILIPVGFINKYSLKTIIKCNLLITPIIIISFIVLFILSIPNFVPQRVFPILGYGASNTFLLGASNIFIFGNIVLLFLIMPILKDCNQFNKISYWGIILSSLFIILTVTSLLLMLPLDISSNSNSPIYIQAKKITLGNFIQRIDTFFVLTWIVEILYYLSIAIAFINSIFKKVANLQDKSTISYVFISILFGVTVMYSNAIQIKTIDLVMYKYVSLILLFGFSFIVLISANIKKKIKGGI